MDLVNNNNPESIEILKSESGESALASLDDSFIRVVDEETGEVFFQKRINLQPCTDNEHAPIKDKSSRRDRSRKKTSKSPSQGRRIRIIDEETGEAFLQKQCKSELPKDNASNSKVVPRHGSKKSLISSRSRSPRPLSYTGPTTVKHLPVS